MVSEMPQMLDGIDNCTKSTVFNHCHVFSNGHCHAEQMADYLYIYQQWQHIRLCILQLSVLYPTKLVMYMYQPGLWSRSRRLGLETYTKTYQRFVVSVSSWEKLSTSQSQEAEVSVSPQSRSRPFTSRAQDQFSAKFVQATVCSVNGL